MQRLWEVPIGNWCSSKGIATINHANQEQTAGFYCGDNSLLVSGLESSIATNCTHSLRAHVREGERPLLNTLGDRPDTSNFLPHEHGFSKKKKTRCDGDIIFTHVLHLYDFCMCRVNTKCLTPGGGFFACIGTWAFLTFRFWPYLRVCLGHELMQHKRKQSLATSRHEWM